MRLAIRKQLIDSVPDVQGRVFEPQAATPETTKPYFVIVQAVDNEDTQWTGFRRIVEVWPYAARTSFNQVDALAAKVIAALDKQLLSDVSTGEAFTCQYIGTTGSDIVDEEWDAITRGLRFAVLALQPVAVTETVQDDPWLEALASWTGTVMGVDWSVYRGLWPLGYSRPAVLWRIAGIEVGSLMNAAFEVRKRFVGHVIGRTPNEQMVGAMQLVEQLGSAIKVPVDPANHRYMTVVDPRADLQADALTGGQVTVTMSRRTMRPTEDAPLIMGVHNSGFIQD